MNIVTVDGVMKMAYCKTSTGAYALVQGADDILID
jgi:hypothetical protein